MREPKLKTQKLPMESGKTYLTRKLKELKDIEKQVVYHQLESVR